MPRTALRKARTHSELIALSQDAAVTLGCGEWFVEQDGEIVRFFGDEHGSRHVADLAMLDFIDGLARRDIVFVSWG